MDSSDDEPFSPVGTNFLLKSETQQLKERNLLRRKYEELINIAQKEKENDEIDTNKIVQNMNQAEELFQSVSRTREAVYDAKLVHIHGEVVKKAAHQIHSGSPFSSTVFLKNMAAVLSGSRQDSDVINLGEEAWLKLGNKVFQMFKRTPKLNFVQGTYQEPAETVRQPRRVRQKEKEGKTLEPKVIDAATNKINTDKTYEEIQRIKKMLQNIYKHEGEPICYFRFTIDPHSFSRTIENMFHLSFLIKEREVHLSLNNDKLPVLEPVLSGQTSGKSETSQSVLTMNMSKWKQLIEVFEIQEPAIPPMGSSKI